MASGVLFTPDDDVDLVQPDREILLPRDGIDCISLEYDFNSRNPEDLSIFKDLKHRSGISSHYIAKKALQPLSVISIIAGTYVLGEISKGLLSKLAGDCYEFLKSTLKRLFEKRKDGESEKLLCLEVAATCNGEKFVLEIIVTNPTNQDIDDLLGRHLANIDQTIAKHFINGIGLRKLVYEVQNGELKMQFAIRKDCFPLASLGDHPPA